MEYRPGQRVKVTLDETLQKEIWYGSIVPKINCHKDVDILVELDPNTSKCHRYLPGIKLKKHDEFVAPFGDGSFLFKLELLNRI